MTLCNCPPRAIPRVNCVKTRDREFLRRDHCRCGSAIIITPFSKVGSVSKNIFKFCTLRWYQTWSQKSLVNSSIPGEMLILAEMPGWIWSYQWERLSFMNPGHLWNENCQDFKKKSSCVSLWMVHFSYFRKAGLWLKRMEWAPCSLSAASLITDSMP